MCALAAQVAIGPCASEAMVVAARLHDVVEDTPVSLDEIACLFGEEVAGLVS
jgi:GTP diphosphokinase / guanosine-3',5'-bis(diphosphate) 3'-diphosphatase